MDDVEEIEDHENINVEFDNNGNNVQQKLLDYFESLL